MGNKNIVSDEKCLANEIATKALSCQGEHGVKSSSEKESTSLVNGGAPWESCEDEKKKPSTKLTSPTSQHVVKAMYIAVSRNKIG